MLPIALALKLTSKSKIAVEISERRKLLDYMVGSLYPRIVENDIERLTDRLSVCVEE